MIQRKTKAIQEFGDFQTPDDLAIEVASTLYRYGIGATSVVEPTCGRGALLISTLKAFPQVEQAIGADINHGYLQMLQKRLVEQEIQTRVVCVQTDFFITNWQNIIDKLPEPILIVGNPPWVTSSDLSTLQSSNLPEKSNFQGHTGLNAITGKSNFDISEWMLLQNMKWLRSKIGSIAVLCKTTVARKILLAAWKANEQVNDAKIFRIDAKKYFDASVDACLFVLRFNQGAPNYSCQVFNSLSSMKPESEIGYRNHTVIPNLQIYDELSCLLGEDSNYIWRSGIKHDCSKVMELECNNGVIINGHGFSIDIEDDFLFPLLKSSDIGNDRVKSARKFMLVTQRYVGEDTSRIRSIAPKTWNYLQQNCDALKKRGSSIYKNRPAFSIFGVGDYTFTDWKVAISGFYKKLQFAVVGPIEKKPVVFDDTVYFLSCASEEEAHFIARLLKTDLAAKFYNSLIFWEDKRPITVEVLKKLNLRHLAREYGEEDLYMSLILRRAETTSSDDVKQLRLLEKHQKYIIRLDR